MKKRKILQNKEQYFVSPGDKSIKGIINLNTVSATIKIHFFNGNVFIKLLYKIIIL